MTKLTDLVKNPQLKNLGREGYIYTIKFKGEQKKHQAEGHMAAVHMIIQGLLDKQKLSVEQILSLKAVASYHLLVEVTDMKDNDAKIKESLAKVNWQNRYSLKHRITDTEGRIYIVCREWTSKRVDKLISLITEQVHVERTAGPGTTVE